MWCGLFNYLKTKQTQRHSTFNPHSVGPHIITVGCSKSYTWRLKSRPSCQHPNAIFRGPTSLSNGSKTLKIKKLKRRRRRRSLCRTTYLAHAVAASGVFVGGRLCGVKLGPCLLEAICARQALNPTQIAPSVHNDRKFLRRCSERNFHQVVATARRHRTGHGSTRLLFVRFHFLH